MKSTICILSVFVTAVIFITILLVTAVTVMNAFLIATTINIIAAVISVLALAVTNYYAFRILNICTLL